MTGRQAIQFFTWCFGIHNLLYVGGYGPILGTFNIIPGNGTEVFICQFKRYEARFHWFVA